MNKNMYWSPHKLPVILVRFCWEFYLFDNFKNLQKKIRLHKNPSSGSLVVPCGRTDMTKLIVPFLISRTRIQTSLAVPQLHLCYCFRSILKKNTFIFTIRISTYDFADLGISLTSKIKLKLSNLSLHTRGLWWGEVVAKFFLVFGTTRWCSGQLHVLVNFTSGIKWKGAG